MNEPQPPTRKETIAKYLELLDRKTEVGQDDLYDLCLWFLNQALGIEDDER